jgi:hypothetical protein
MALIMGLNLERVTKVGIVAGALLLTPDQAQAQNQCTPVSPTRTDCGIFRLERPTANTQDFVDVHINVARPKSAKNWEQSVAHGIGEGVNYVEQQCGIQGEGGNETRLMGYLRVFLRQHASECLPFQRTQGLITNVTRVALLNVDKASYVVSRLS